MTNQMNLGRFITRRPLRYPLIFSQLIQDSLCAVLLVLLLPSMQTLNSGHSLGCSLLTLLLLLVLRQSGRHWSWLTTSGHWRTLKRTSWAESWTLMACSPRSCQVASSDGPVTLLCTGSLGVALWSLQGFGFGWNPFMLCKVYIHWFKILVFSHLYLCIPVHKTLKMTAFCFSAVASFILALLCCFNAFGLWAVENNSVALKSIVDSFWVYAIILGLGEYNVNFLVIVCRKATHTGFLITIFCWQNWIRQFKSS